MHGDLCKHLEIDSSNDHPDVGTSIKEKSLLPEGANCFLYEQFLIVWKITSIILSDLP